MKEKRCPPHGRAAAAPYPDGTVVDHQPDVPKRAGLVLGEHGARDGAGRAQQQAALVPRHQRAPPQVSADEPARPVVLVEGVPLVPQRHDVDGPAGRRGAEERSARSAPERRREQEVRGRRAEAGLQPLPRGAGRAGGRQRQDPAAYVHGLGSQGRATTRRKKGGSPRPPGAARDAWTRTQLIPGRDPLAGSTAVRPTQSGPRRAASTRSGACGAGRVRGAGGSGSAREHPGRPRRAAPRLRPPPPPPPREPRAPWRCSPSPPRALGRAAVAVCGFCCSVCCSSSWPKGVRRKAGPPPPRRGGRGGRSTCRPRGVGRSRGTRSRGGPGAREAAEYK